MKKRSLFLLSAFLIFSLTMPIFTSCSSDNGEDESDTSIETGTLIGSEQLSPEGSVLFPDNDESESEDESPTEKETEKVTEKEPETETEQKSHLKYLSYGNGTCAVSGIGDYTDVYVIIPEKSPSGDIVTAIDDKAFFENTRIKGVQIPSTVMSIGNMAFGGCSSLVCITVNENNKAFTDINGVLYSKDKTKLILFPSANQASELTLSVNITEIADMAFYSTPSLKYIKYGGTLLDWSKIKVGDKNYGLYSASMTFATTE